MSEPLFKQFSGLYWEPFSDWPRDEFVFRMGMWFQAKRTRGRYEAPAIYETIMLLLLQGVKS